MRRLLRGRGLCARKKFFAGKGFCALHRHRLPCALCPFRVLYESAQNINSIRFRLNYFVTERRRSPPTYWQTIYSENNILTAKRPFVLRIIRSRCILLYDAPVTSTSQYMGTNRILIDRLKILYYYYFFFLLTYKRFAYVQGPTDEFWAAINY